MSSDKKSTVIIENPDSPLHSSNFSNISKNIEATKIEKNEKRTAIITAEFNKKENPTLNDLLEMARKKPMSVEMKEQGQQTAEEFHAQLDPEITYNVRFYERPFGIHFERGNENINLFVNIPSTDKLAPESLLVGVNGFDVRGYSSDIILKKLKECTLPAVLTFQVF